eukprot:scaffold3151_cov385-Prasinococcus_capsulatus_cf.AAC.2
MRCGAQAAEVALQALYRCRHLSSQMTAALLLAARHHFRATSKVEIPDACKEAALTLHLVHAAHIEL